MRTLQGTIVSQRMQKTVVVRVERLVRHPLYAKFHRASRRYHAHADDAAGYRVGDVVRMVETRPLSKKKRWRVVGVIRRSSVSADLPEAADVGGATEQP